MVFSPVTEHLGLFFEPVELHLEVADVAVELRDQILLVFIVLGTSMGKQTRELFEELFALLTNLIGMDPKLTGQLGEGLFSFHCLQGYLRFKRAIVVFAYGSDHSVPPSSSGRLSSTLVPCPVFGE